MRRDPVPFLVTSSLILSVCGAIAHVRAENPEAPPAGTTASPTVAPRVSADSSAFRAAMKARAATAQKNFESVVPGREGWLFFAPELRHIGIGRWWGADAAKASQSIEPENADPLPAILDFKAQLDRAGIELLIVPVPPKAVVYADKIWKPHSEMYRLDSLHLLHHEFYDLLRQNGIQVLDLTRDFMLAGWRDKEPLYCRTDTHWNGRAMVIAGQRIKEELKGRPWLTGGKKYHSEFKRVPFDGDLRAALPKSRRGPRESAYLRFISNEWKPPAGGKPRTPVAEDKNSPVLLLGDSYTLVFHEGGDMHTRGAGLADQLALELGFPIDVVGVRGSGATPARVNLMRRARADKNYLARKKLVIWCFSAREWTESLGWNKVPVVPEG